MKVIFCEIKSLFEKFPRFFTDYPVFKNKSIWRQPTTLNLYFHAFIEINRQQCVKLFSVSMASNILQSMRQQSKKDAATD